VNGDGGCGPITTEGVAAVEKASFATANATSYGKAVEAAVVAAAPRVDPNATPRHLPAEAFKSAQEQRWKGSLY
jgi:hypothetical protein